MVCPTSIFVTNPSSAAPQLPPPVASTTTREKCGLDELGISPPTIDEYVRLCRLGCDPYKTRIPGFLAGRKAASALAAGFRRRRRDIEFLARNELPEPPGNGNADARWAGTPSYAEYYRDWYPALYRESEDNWAALTRLIAVRTAKLS